MSPLPVLTEARRVPGLATLVRARRIDVIALRTRVHGDTRSRIPALHEEPLHRRLPFDLQAPPRAAIDELVEVAEQSIEQLHDHRGFEAASQRREPDEIRKEDSRVVDRVSNRRRLEPQSVGNGIGQNVPKERLGALLLLFKFATLLL